MNIFAVLNTTQSQDQYTHISKCISHQLQRSFELCNFPTQHLFSVCFSQDFLNRHLGLIHFASMCDCSGVCTFICPVTVDGFTEWGEGFLQIVTLLINHHPVCSCDRSRIPGLHKKVFADTRFREFTHTPDVCWIKDLSKQCLHFCEVAVIFFEVCTTLTSMLDVRCLRK